MSFALDVAMMAAVVVLARWVARNLRAKAPANGAPVESSEASPAEGLFAGFPCALGDVVVRTAERDEAWLAGALVLQEERPIAALFIAPEAGGDRVVLAHQGEDDLAWLMAVPVGSLVLPSDPPHVLEHAGVRFERVRRLPVRVRRIGAGAPSLGERAIVAEYSGPSTERLVVAAGAEQTMAWVGAVLRKSDFDVLPGGKETTEPSA